MLSRGGIELMTVNEVKEKLAKKAVVFHTGGIRPTKALLESWIGCVCWRLPGEMIPVDKEGKKMQPIATFFLKDLPYVPECLQGIELITVFISENLCGHDDIAEEYVHIRTYKTLEGLEQCDENASIMRAFPLVPKLVEDDYPIWDDAGFPGELFEEILRLEEDEDIEYYEDIVEENYYIHKVGGYPAFIQAGDFFEGYEFAFQISSDEKAQFNFVDSGQIYFFYNRETQDWKVQYDFY